MRTDQANMTHSEALVLAVSLELAAAKWKVALHDGRRDSPNEGRSCGPGGRALGHGAPASSPVCVGPVGRW